MSLLDHTVSELIQAMRDDLASLKNEASRLREENALLVDYAMEQIHVYAAMKDEAFRLREENVLLRDRLLKAEMMANEWSARAQSLGWKEPGLVATLTTESTRRWYPGGPPKPPGNVP